MSKYIDLWRQISASDVYNSDDRRIIRETLYWLDDHPDQVPGRTITESELGEVTRTHESIRDLVNLLGITIVPDPEPTNAEFIDKLLTEFAQLNASCGGEQGDHDLAEFLDARGVRVTTDD